MLYVNAMLRKALVLAILSVSTPAYAANSDTIASTGMTVLAFVILLGCLSRLVVPEREEN